MSNTLCEDLIVEIFTRLPPKSLLRFTSLSKSIYSLITSPDFIHKHKHNFRSSQKVLIKHKEYYADIEDVYTLHSQDPLLLCHEHVKNETTVKFPFGRYCKIVGSCNGIVCLRDDQSSDISLWNPSVRRKLTLSDRPSKCKFSSYNVLIGFGFDQTADDYKILRLSHSKYFGETYSFVYTMKTDAWSLIDPPTTPFTDMMSDTCFFNGTLHWVVRSDSTELFGADHYYIMTFDLSCHVFGTIELPEPTWETRQLAIIEGSLAVISKIDDNYWIWLRKENNDTFSWFSNYKFDLGQFGEVRKLLGLDTNGNFLASFLNDDFIAYNHKTGELLMLEEFSFSSQIDDMEMLVESLELLDTGTSYEEIKLAK